MGTGEVKTTAKLLYAILMVLPYGVAEGAATLTFDDLSPAPNSSLIISNGYGGLQWYYFGVLNGSAISSYSNGVVSTPNVPFNISGEPASISSTNSLFDLNSAYLFSPILDGLQVRVRAFTGPILSYDNTYTLSTNGSKLIQFDYTNVNRAEFLTPPSSGFVMDDLQVDFRNVPIPHVPVNLGEVQATNIGHRFTLGIHGYNYVRDFLVDQSQSSSGGSALPTVSVNWDNFDQFILKVLAPAGFRFLVQGPAGATVGFGGELMWVSTGGGSGQSGPLTVSLDSLEGVAPYFTESSAALSDSYGYFGCYSITSTSFTNDIAFTSMTFRGTVTPHHTGLEAKYFVPDTNSILVLSYLTSQTNDPGSFVSIVPVVAVPSLQITAISPETGVSLSVRGKPGLTTIVESSEDMLSWVPISTNMMPSTVSPSVEVIDAGNSSVGQRFYRAFQVQ